MQTAFRALAAALLDQVHHSDLFSFVFTRDNDKKAELSHMHRVCKLLTYVRGANILQDRHVKVPHMHMHYLAVLHASQSVCRSFLEVTITMHTNGHKSTTVEGMD